MGGSGSSGAASRSGGRRGTGSGGYDAESTGSTFTLSDRLTVDFTHTHIADCDPVCILKREPIWSWDARAFAILHSAAVVPHPLFESAVPAAEPPDPDSDDTEP